MEQLKRMDFVGLFLFSGGLAVFLIGLAWGSGTYPWKSAHVIATIVVGAVVLIIFVLYGKSTVYEINDSHSLNRADAYVHPGDPLMPIHL